MQPGPSSCPGQETGAQKIGAIVRSLVCLGKTGPILKRALRGVRIEASYGMTAVYAGADHRVASAIAASWIMHPAAPAASRGCVVLRLRRGPDAHRAQISHAQDHRRVRPGMPGDGAVATVPVERRDRRAGRSVHRTWAARALA